MEHLEGAKQYSNSKVYCNCCGGVISEAIDSKEEYLEVNKAWSCFSSKDIAGNTFRLCETCYATMIASFKIPIEEFPIDEVPNYSDDVIDALNAAYAAELCK